MPNHGVYVNELATAVSTPVAVETGIPFVIGLAPVHTADNPAAAGQPDAEAGLSGGGRSRHHDHAPAHTMRLNCLSSLVFVSLTQTGRPWGQ